MASVVDVLIEALQLLTLAAGAAPEIQTLGETAIALANSSSITPEQEAAARADMDAVRLLIDKA